MDIIQVDPDAIYPCSSITRSIGFTNLMYLVYNTREHPEYLIQIKYILDHYPEELDKQNDIGWTALMIAVRNSCKSSTLDTVKLLLDYHPDLYIITRPGDDILTLSYLTYKYNTKTIDLLINHIDMNKIVGYNTVFFRLIKNIKSLNFIEYILKNADVDLSFTNYLTGQTVYDYVVHEKYNVNIINLIKKYQDTSLDVKCALD